MKGIKMYFSVAVMVLGMGAAVAQDQLMITPPEYYYNYQTFTCEVMPVTTECSPNWPDPCKHHDHSSSKYFNVYDTRNPVTLRCEQQLFFNP